MIILNDAKDYLNAMGVTLPDTLLQLLMDRVESIDECLDEHYDEGTAQLISLYLLGLMAAANGARMISSQTAPSGASRSFRYQSVSDMWKGLSGLLRSLDTRGCTDGLVPPDPTQTLHAGLWIGKGECMGGGCV